jgi:integrase
MSGVREARMSGRQTSLRNGVWRRDQLEEAHVDAWRLGLAELIEAGDYSPTTLNGWLAVLKVVMKAAKRQFSLPHLATEGVESFDTSEHDTYTDEEPNALTPEEVPAFLATCRELHPSHYAMICLGLVTGLRPSSLRPLRRRGEESDVEWETGRIRVRRSHSLGEEIMRTTKQKRRYSITLPAEAMDVLRWHVATQLTTPEQQESDLLFPAVNGKFRSPSVLNKPLDEVALELGLSKHITQRALRRTFNDLARAASVNDLVTRSISGHLTERMQHHYSTVNGGEQRAALAKVISLFAAPSGEASGEGPSSSGEGRPKTA